MNINLNVLIVDDMHTMRHIMKNVLKQLGFTHIFEAENGQEAFAQIEPHKIELIISDWNMPVMSGLDFLKKVRSTPATKHVPFLMVTAEGEKDHVSAAIREGVNNYIVKPFTAELVKKKLEMIFNKPVTK
jgi:two-component system chemotaxis response regulator CheY